MKALVLIGGITVEKYILKDVLNHQKLKEVLSRYDKILEIDCEKHFDSWSLPLRTWDRFGDVVKFGLNTARRHAAQVEVERTICRLHAEGYEVDVWSHSLGTWILAGSTVSLNHVLMAGSPICFPTLAARSFVQSSLRKWPFGPLKNDLMECKKLTFLWSPKDIVCNRPLPEDFRFGAKEVFNYNQNDTHDFVNYLNLGIKIGVL